MSALKAGNYYIVRSGVSLGAFKALISASSSLVAQQANQMQWKWGLLTLDANQGSRSFFSAAFNLGNDSRNTSR